MFLKIHNILTKSLTLLAFTTVIFQMEAAQAAITPPPGPAETVILGWDAVPESDIQGYRIYVGAQSQQYSLSYDAGAGTTFPVSQLESGKTYYFAVSAIGSTGLESELSSELVVVVAPKIPSVAEGVGTPSLSGSPGNFAIKMTVTEIGSYVLERSEDLVTWTVVSTTLVTGPGLLEFNDTQAALVSGPPTGKLFYRIGRQ